MVALRADHDVDGRLTAQDFGALGLCDATSHHEGRAAAGLAALVLDLAKLAEFGEDFLGRPFANMASVEDDEIGLFDATSASRYPSAVARSAIRWES